MSARSRLLRRLHDRRSSKSADGGGAGIGRREFMEGILVGAAVFTTSWVATDKLYESVGSPYEEKWLRDYYKSDFFGV